MSTHAEQIKAAFYEGMDRGALWYRQPLRGCKDDYWNDSEARKLSLETENEPTYDELQEISHRRAVKWAEAQAETEHWKRKVEELSDVGEHTDAQCTLAGRRRSPA